VPIESCIFAPPSVDTKPGGAVEWTDRDGEDHTATGDKFNTGFIHPGTSKAIKI